MFRLLPIMCCGCGGTPYNGLNYEAQTIKNLGLKVVASTNGGIDICLCFICNHKTLFTFGTTGLFTDALQPTKHAYTKPGHGEEERGGFEYIDARTKL